MALKMLKTNDNKVIANSSGKINKTVMNWIRNLTNIPNIKNTKKSTFLISNAKKTFNHLRKVFIKAPIL